MAYTTSAVAPRHIEFTETPVRAAAKSKRGFWGRLLDAMIAARTRQAEREIALYLNSGVKFTDETEREVERRFLANTSRW